MGGSSSKEEEAEKKQKEEEAKKKQKEEETNNKLKEEERKKQNEDINRLLRIVTEQQIRLEESRRQWEVEKNSMAVERQLFEEARKHHEQQKQIDESRFLQNLNLGKITPNLPLINDLRKLFYLGGPLKKLPQPPYEKIELNKSSQEYMKIATMFKKSNKLNFTITGIVKIKNPFHLIQYHIMKRRRMCDDYHVNELLMFHGTKEEFIDGICTYNFDKSKVRVHKFGHGTSFARDAYFATHYHMDNKRNNVKVMVVAKVFCGTMQESNEHTVIPEAPYYTSANNDRSVIVKYDDASSVPLYVIHYEGLHPPKASRSVQPAF